MIQFIKDNESLDPEFVQKFNMINFYDENIKVNGSKNNQTEGEEKIIIEHITQFMEEAKVEIKNSIVNSKDKSTVFK